GTTPDRMPSAIDGCGVPTYAVTLKALARAYAFLADPAAIAATDPRAPVAAPLATIRDAMLANPELVGGTRERIDTSLMKALPGAVVSKGGQEGLRAIALLVAGRQGEARWGAPRRATGLVVKIDDGSGHDRAGWAAAVEAL